MILLGIETAGSRCSAAVGGDKDGRVFAAESEPLRHGHVEVLMPMVDRVMARAGLSPGQLDAVAVAVGPGGFTGIRVGLAAARGIALALGARLIGISGFAAVAHALTPRAEASGGASWLLAALDSRREDLYVQLFAYPSLHGDVEPAALPAAALAGYLDMAGASGPLLIAGDAASEAAAELSERWQCNIAPNSAPDALGVLAAARAALKSGTVDAPVRPLYLRPPDVNLPRPGPANVVRA